MDLLADLTGTLHRTSAALPGLLERRGHGRGPIGFTGRTDGVRGCSGICCRRRLSTGAPRPGSTRCSGPNGPARSCANGTARGFPDEWVDTHELAQHWAGANPSVPSGILLQAAWLGSGASSIEQKPDRLLQSAPTPGAGELEERTLREIEERRGRARRHEQRTVLEQLAQRARPLERPHRRSLSPTQSDPAAERELGLDRASAHAPALAFADHAERLADAEAAGGVGAEVDRSRTGERRPPSRTRTSSQTIGTPARARPASVELFPTPFSPSRPQTPPREERAGMKAVMAGPIRPHRGHARQMRVHERRCRGRDSSRNVAWPAARSITTEPPSEPEGARRPRPTYVRRAAAARCHAHAQIDAGQCDGAGTSCDGGASIPRMRSRRRRARYCTEFARMPAKHRSPAALHQPVALRPTSS